MPSDRFTGLGVASTKNSAFGGSSNLSNRNTVARSNYLSSNQQPIKYNNNNNGRPGTRNDTKSNKPKKYVSMSRLDQLAQPKKSTRNNNLKTTNNTNSNVPPSSLTSSNATSTTTSSLTSNKNYTYSTTSRSSTGGTTQVRRQSGSSLKGAIKQQADSKPTNVSSKLSNKERTPAALKVQNDQLKQQARQQPTPRPISSRQMPRDSLKESTPIRSAETVSQSGSSSRSISPINVLNETMDRPSRGDIGAAILPTPPVSAVKQQVNESSLADQLSEMSVNERLYESAASELVPDSENNSTNGINYDRNPDSLCRELEQDLIAKGIVNNDLIDNIVDLNGGDDDDDDQTPTATTDRNNVHMNDVRRELSATVLTPNDKNYQYLENTPKITKADVEEKQRRIRDEEEEEKRLKIEEELREKARLEAEEREKRASLVDSILSRLSQNP